MSSRRRTAYGIASLSQVDIDLEGWSIATLDIWYSRSLGRWSAASLKFRVLYHAPDLCNPRTTPAHMGEVRTTSPGT